jgi:putative transposase
MAVNQQCPQGARGQGMSLMRDHGCPPTSATCMQACAPLGSHQAFTSYNHPKGNADTERFMRTRKEECLWLREWTWPLELLRTRKDWLAHDNDHYLHSALAFRSPSQYEQDNLSCQSSPFVAT